MTITMIFSVVISVGLFMVLPYLIASLLRKVGAGESAVTVAEAFIRIVLFLAYLVLIFQECRTFKESLCIMEQNINVLTA